jgi:hypothetical protein
LRILLFSRDLGGANQLAALHMLLSSFASDGQPSWMPHVLRTELGLNALHSGQLDMVIIAKDFARQTWKREGIAYQDWDGLAATADPNTSARRVLESIKPDILITATSDVDDRTDVGLWTAARMIGIPSAAFVDHGVCLRERFLDNQGRLVIPDHVFLPDPDVVHQMEQVSGTSAQLVVCGDLHLLRLPARAKAVSSAMIEATRQSWDLQDGDIAILFPSEPRREIAGAGRPFHDYEDDTFRKLGDFLARGGKLPGIPPGARHVIVVRPHPKDTPGKYDQLVGASPVPCVIDVTPDVVRSILSADIVVGLDSTVMLEAHSLGRPVYGLVQRSLFVDRMGPDFLVDIDPTASSERRVGWMAR